MTDVTGMMAVVDATGVDVVIIRLRAGFSEDTANRIAGILSEGFKGTSLEGVRIMCMSDDFDIQFVRTK